MESWRDPEERSTLMLGSYEQVYPTEAAILLYPL